MKNNYEVCLEISGPTAMWTRPDTGDAPVSYPAPTSAAVKAIFESILWIQSAEVVPAKVEICKPLVYHTYSTNYGGPLRKSRVVRDGGSFQLLATVLINVCYRCYARIEADRSRETWYDKSRKTKSGISNGAHAYQDMFRDRLRKGQSFFTPCLGWREFVPDYVGDFRLNSNVCDDIDLALPSMLHSCFPAGKNSAWNPKFRQSRIEKGVLIYAQ